MTLFVLRFKGSAERELHALNLLRTAMPGSLFTRKATRLVEAQVTADHVPLLRALSDWEVSLPSYAEIRSPSRDLARLLDKLP